MQLIVTELCLGLIKPQGVLEIGSIVAKGPEQVLIGSANVLHQFVIKLGSLGQPMSGKTSLLPA